MLQSRKSDSLMRNRRSFPVVSCCQKPKLVRDGVRPRLKSNGYWKAMQINETRPLGEFLVFDF
jgi:hypothetical protein